MKNAGHDGVTIGAVAYAGPSVDIYTAIPGEGIRNGSVTVKAPGRGTKALVAQYYDDNMVTKPTIVELDTKYGDRVDDPRYYSGDTAD
jgi:hypothetical protein